MAPTRRSSSEGSDVGDRISPLILAGVETAQSFSIFAPDAYTLRRDRAADHVDARSLRASYLPAAGLGLGIAAAISYAARSWGPVLVSAATSLGMVATYERTLPDAIRLDPVRALGEGLRNAGMLGRAAGAGRAGAPALESASLVNAPMRAEIREAVDAGRVRHGF